MQKGATGEAHVHVDALPEAVYAVVTDVTRMGEWSPETKQCVWVDGATGPAVGARFKGSNKRGIARWSTTPTVVVADPGREFAFEVHDQTRWVYRCEAEGAGTKLSESFEMLSDVPKYVAFVERWIMGIKDRKADLERGMQTTLDRIKLVVESEPS